MNIYIIEYIFLLSNNIIGRDFLLLIAWLINSSLSVQHPSMMHHLLKTSNQQLYARIVSCRLCGLTTVVTFSNNIIYIERVPSIGHEYSCLYVK